jgi:hypothetical protein
LGVIGLPIVAKGDHYVIGFDPTKIDALVGFSDTRDRSLLPGHELVARSRAMLEAAARYARQLRPYDYDILIPGMEGVEGPLVLPDGTVLRLPDGTPYLPHRTTPGLVGHSLAHGVKFGFIAQHPDYDVTDVAVFALIGEPREDVSINWLVRELARVADEIWRWWQMTAGADLAHEMRTYMGPKSLHEMLQAMAYSLVPHTRQLMTILVDLGIAPDGPLTEDDRRGFDLPANVWE